MTINIPDGVVDKVSTNGVKYFKLSYTVSHIILFLFFVDVPVFFFPLKKESIKDSSILFL